MPVFIESLVTEFTVFDQELPLSQAQLDQVAAYILGAIRTSDLRDSSMRSLAQLDRGSEEAFDRQASG